MQEFVKAAYNGSRSNNSAQISARLQLQQAGEEKIEEAMSIMAKL
jgi:hypothetical protein